MSRKIPGVVVAAILAIGAYACGAAIEAPLATAQPEQLPLGPYNEDSLVDSVVVADSSAIEPPAVGDTVFVLKRLSALLADASTSATIGPDGGVLRIPDAGVEVTFPAGAVAAPTTITMTAKAGWDVAYEFAPHGLTFAVPITVTQSTDGTLAEKHPRLGRTLQGTYYGTSLDSAFVDPWKLFARSQEARKGTYNGSTRELQFTVEHFSGYLVSSGRQQ